MYIILYSNSKSMPIYKGFIRNTRRAQPEGLRNITECNIHEKACRRRALTSLYPGDEIITR